MQTQFNAFFNVHLHCKISAEIHGPLLFCKWQPHTHTHTHTHTQKGQLVDSHTAVTLIKTNDGGRALQKYAKCKTALWTR